MKRLLPSYPLFVKDPYFSVWANGDTLNAQDTVFWNGSIKRTEGRIIADGRIYSFLGDIKDAEKLVQKDINISAYSTDYTFSCAEFDCVISFLSPLPPDNLKMLSCPVCYLKYSITPKKLLKKISVMLSLNQEYAYDAVTGKTLDDDAVSGGHIRGRSMESAWMGLRKQGVLNHALDSCSADWGYFYLEAERAYYHSIETFKDVIEGRHPDFIDDRYEKWISAVNTHDGNSAEGMILVAFDDVQSINYFGDHLKGYFYKNGKCIFDALDYARRELPAAEAADKSMSEYIVKASAPYGEDYKKLLFAALRQSVGAHKLVEDKEGRLLFLSKECHSNGCIATVDVSYPSIPLYLLTNPELVRGMMTPILDFARMPAWEFDFAPHDAGCYPHCCGQVYGMKGTEDTKSNFYPYGKQHGNFYPIYQLPAGNDLYRIEDQMPVEECSNLLIMFMMYHKYSKKKDIAFLKDNFDLMEKWVQYLIKYGFIPEKQLCTDDFAGKMSKNVNLSIKASMGIAAFALIAQVLGKKDIYEKMYGHAKDHAAKLTAMFEKLSFSPLAMDMSEESYSLKYNLAIDILLKTGLYPEKFLESEVDCYLSKSNKYGVPLDTRKDYTKSDWILWAAVLTKDNNKAAQLIAPIAKYLEETADRVPFSDWYDTVTGKQSGFQNRTVQGGLFILLLK